MADTPALNAYRQRAEGDFIHWSIAHDLAVELQAAIAILGHVPFRILANGNVISLVNEFALDGDEADLFRTLGGE